MHPDCLFRYAPKPAGDLPLEPVEKVLKHILGGDAEKNGDLKLCMMIQ